VETFSEPKELVQDARYQAERREALAGLAIADIDEPLVDLIRGFATLRHCFTLQCCYGHFICDPEQDARSFEPIPDGHDGPVRYRIAYIAFGIENSERGRGLRQSLARIPAIDPDYVQFGSADWFWDRRVNTYALQVMPLAHKLEDETILDTPEALHTEATRDLFFRELRALLSEELRERQED
jgi:hypothetical protein